MTKLNSGVQYERVCADKLRAAGWRVEETGRSGDFGADLICKSGGEKLVVQCKFYSRTVGIAAVQEALGARAHYAATKAAVMTNSTFTTAAKKLAFSADVLLIKESGRVPKPQRIIRHSHYKANASQGSAASGRTQHEFRPPSVMQSKPIPQQNGDYSNKKGEGPSQVKGALKAIRKILFVFF